MEYLNTILLTVLTAFFGLVFIGVRSLLLQNKELRDEMRAGFKTLPTIYKTKAACEAEISAGRCLARIANIMDRVDKKLDVHYQAYKEKTDTQGEMVDVLKSIKKYMWAGKKD